MTKKVTSINPKSYIPLIFAVLCMSFIYIMSYPQIWKLTPIPPAPPHTFYPKELTQSSTGSHNHNVDWLDDDVTIVRYEDLAHLNQRDHRLINYLKARHLSPPSMLPYNFNGTLTFTPGEDSGITGSIRQIFKNMTNGFFVECGGYDGIYSNTLFLEREYNWTGLLIECNPVLVPELKKTHRKAYTADVCISITQSHQTINITSMDKWPASSSAGTGDIFPHHISSNFTRFEVESFPIYSIIAATGIQVVDFITLDVQSIEWKVMQNFPFDLILVKVWVIEIVLLTAEDRTALQELMAKNGYKIDKLSSGDYLFVHNTVYSNQ